MGWREDGGGDTKLTGKVWIVGAGPGDPELLTLKARRLLDEAEVIFYDALVSVETLRSIVAECVFVGKRRGFRAFGQEEINLMLRDAARAGRRVVRLKGGDPFIFGRGGEEALYLRGHGIDCEVVPGVSAALAAAASAQIPLTHRGVATSLALCAGVPAPSGASSSSEGRRAAFDLPSADTLVVYMGASSAACVAEQLLAQGRSPETPVALVHNASLPDEGVWTRTLAELASMAELPTPLLLIIGEVVRLGGEAKRGEPASFARSER